MKLFNLKIFISGILSLTIVSSAFANDRSLVSINAKAYGLYIKGKYNSALTTYKRGLGLYPHSASLHDGIGAVYLKKKQYDQAYKNFYVASQLDTSNSVYKIHAQDALYKAHISKINQAKYLISSAYTFAPNNAVVFKNFGNIRDGKLHSLEMVYCVSQNANDTAILKGNEAFWKKDYKKAEQFYQKSIKSHPKNYEAYNNLGLANLELSSINNAIINFRKAANLNPKLAQAYNNLGIAYARLNRFNEANKNFDLSIKAGNNYFPAYNNKAVFLVNSIFENIDASIKYLETIVRLEPSNILVKQSLGLLYTLNENYSSAINVYKSGLDLTQDNTSFLKQYADCLYFAGQYQEAVSFYKKAIAINADNSDLFISLARAQEKNGDNQDVFSSYQTSLRINSRNAAAYKYFGLYLLSQKRTSEAKGYLRKYIQLLPNNYDSPYIKRLI